MDLIYKTFFYKEPINADKRFNNKTIKNFNKSLFRHAAYVMSLSSHL